MNRKYVFININTKKGILQTIRKLEHLSEDFYDNEDVESFVVYNEVLTSDNKIDHEASKFSNICYIGHKSDNSVTTRSGRVYELFDNDIVIETANKALCKQYI